MRKRYLAVLVAAILVLGSVGVVSARGFGMMGGFNGMGRLQQGWCHEEGSRPVLDLTEDQLQQMREIQTAFFSHELELRTATFTKNAELRGLLWTKERDEEAIAAKRAELQALREAMQELALERHEAMQAVLTDEQRAELQERNQTRQRMFNGMMQRMGKRFMGARGF